MVQKNAPPGVPVAIRSIEDPLFGPVVSFGISGPLIELLADKAYRIPPLGERDAAAMVREIKSSPMLFGYRGSEVGRRRRGRAADPAGRPAPERPAAGELAGPVAGAGRRRGRHRAHRVGAGGPGRRRAVRLVRPAPARTPRRHGPQLSGGPGVRGRALTALGARSRFALRASRPRIAACDRSPAHRHLDPHAGSRSEGAPPVPGLRVLGARQRADDAVPLRVPRRGPRDPDHDRRFHLRVDGAARIRPGSGGWVDDRPVRAAAGDGRRARRSRRSARRRSGTSRRPRRASSSPRSSWPGRSVCGRRRPRC